jgi:hypothetical protein
MKNSYILAGTIVLTIGIILIVAFKGQLQINSKSTVKDENPYQGLRSQVFTTKPETIGINIEDDNQPYAVLMEIGYPEATATLVSFIDGNASIYFSSGGGVLGGVGHESVRNAAISFVKESSEYLNSMDLVVSYELPDVGHVKFYALTKKGCFHIDEIEDNFNSNKSELTNLFLSGHGVITELRKISEKQN